RGEGRAPLRAKYGGFPIRRNPWVALNDSPKSVWNKRSELLDRLQAERCELCGGVNQIEVHHLRKLADLKGRATWVQLMAARRKKTSMVCQPCHNRIHAGTYDGSFGLKGSPRRAG